ncbi:hypothetical protein MSG28_005954 [Choristoneura fumiferana]|uniref:Uncharacterized protein n=1 Tax=Choristoneura fumiferana TaxID=7141 RepID=A0ACC0L279_CHOFU|nr:hypothetical protein MSG28_005954 [Choristoneura fumiferana]
MGKFSTYRYLELKDDTAAPHINVRSRALKPPRRLKKTFILLIVAALCVTYFMGLFAGQTQWFDGLAKSLGYESEYHHAVIIDAGSSGSRVLAYKFRVPFQRKLGYDTRAGVEIMDGADEGIFIWYTINLLHSLMGGETMAALDLGGGSTQITYQLAADDAHRLPAPDHHTVPTGATNITVYTHSYLNLGLLAARHGIFKMEAGNNVSREMTSVCVDPIVSGEKWTYGNVEYTISGKPWPKGSKKHEAFERCYLLVKKYITATLDWEPEEPPKGKVAAMSYFYDVAADAGLIANTACHSSNVEQPWACVDLTYVLALLHHAYKMSKETPISLFKKVNGHEVSWALGLAYTSVMNRIAETPK